MSFPNQTKIQTSCGQEQYRVLQGSYLVVIPFNCYLKTPDFTISNSDDRIKGHPLKIMELPVYKDQAHTQGSSVILNSIDLGNLHSINEKIALQTPVKLDEISDQSLYHTTIPVYVILLGAAALTIIGLIYRASKGKFARKNQSEDANAATTSSGIYSEIPERRCHPHQIKVTNSPIDSATPSKNISK